MHFRGQASTNMRVNVIDTRLKALRNFFDSVTVDNIELAWLVALKWFLYLLKLYGVNLNISTANFQSNSVRIFE